MPDIDQVCGESLKADTVHNMIQFVITNYHHPPWLQPLKSCRLTLYSKNGLVRTIVKNTQRFEIQGTAHSGLKFPCFL